MKQSEDGNVRMVMRFTAALVCILLAGICSAQVPVLRLRKQPVRIPVRHADPWAVKTMLEGGQLQFPELSTILALMGQTPPASGGGTSLIEDGKLIVNPSDNSLWFIPNN